MKSPKSPSADPGASFRGPTPSDVDARFAEAEQALQAVAPRDTLRTQVPVAEPLVVGPEAAVASEGRQAAGAYVGPTELVATPGAKHPAARVVVGDPAQRAVTQRMVRPVHLPNDQAEQGLVTPVDAVKVGRPARRGAALLLILAVGMGVSGGLLVLWRGATEDVVSESLQRPTASADAAALLDPPAVEQPASLVAPAASAAASSLPWSSPSATIAPSKAPLTNGPTKSASKSPLPKTAPDQPAPEPMFEEEEPTP